METLGIPQPTIFYVRYCVAGDETNRRGPGTKSASKSHALKNCFSRATVPLRIAPAREHDRHFLCHLKLPGESAEAYDKS